MEEFFVGRVRVRLLDLEPVAFEHRVYFDPVSSVLACDHVPGWNDWSRQWSEIGEEEPAHFLHRIGREVHGVLEHGLLRLEGLLDTAAGLVIQPAVVGTPNTVTLEEAIVE